MRVHEINIGYLQLLNHNIIRLELKPDQLIEKPDIEELYAHNTALTKGVNYGLLVIAGRSTNVTPEARKFGASEEISSKRFGLAFVTNKVSEKLIVNFFIKFNKPPTPTKLFSKETEAMLWLNELYRKQKTNQL